MMSDKPFRDNTPNPNIADTPPPLFTKTIDEALIFLRDEIKYFIELYKKDAELKIENPFFGFLNFEEQVHLLYKHALHHLRQFNIIPE